jgi:hypothetical protein
MTVRTRKLRAPAKKKAAPPKKAAKKGKKPGPTTRLARDL